MSIVSDYAKEILAVCVPIGSWLFKRVTEAKVKLQYSVPHAFSYLIHEPLVDPQGKVIKPSQLAHTRSHLIVNAGTKAATKVELVFNYKPQYYNIWPVRVPAEKVDGQQRYCLEFDTLLAKDSFRIELLSVNFDLPDLLVVRCAEGQGVSTHVSVFPTPPKWKIRTILGLSMLGIITVTYGVVVCLAYAGTKYALW